MMKKIIPALLLILFFQSNAYGEENNKIAAVVGGEAISTMDVHNRALMVVSAAAEDTHTVEASSKAVEAATPQALQMLIDEKLYSQEAVRLGITVSAAELDNAIAGIEAKNHLQPGGFGDFLQARQIPIETVREQVRAQILLAKIINAKIRPKVNVTERELELEITRLGGNNRSLSLKQLFVPLAGKTADERDKLRGQLEHIQRKVKGCESFDTVAAAENASLTPTLLTVSTASLNPAIRDVVNGLEIGVPSPVLQTEDSFQLLMVCEEGKPAITTAQKQQLSSMLMERKVELQAKQYLRDLRQEAYVEVR